MRLTKSSFGCIAVTLASVTWLGCHEEAQPQTSAAATAAPATAAPVLPPQPPNPGAGNSGVAEAGPPPGPASVPDKACPASDFTIDSSEDNDNQVERQGGRNGYWYTYADKQGTTISPPAHTKFLMSPSGHDSKYAAHILGKVSVNGDPLFAGMGFSFTDPKGPYDATKYTGVSFWAKVGAASTKTVRLKVPDVNTDPDGRVCKECFNDFGADLTLTDQWKKYTIPFAAMKQMKDWGDPNPAAINKAKLYGVQFQVNDSGATYDLWIDDLQFTGC